jgi:hypothetical protein
MWFRYKHSSQCFNEDNGICDEKGGVDARLIHASITALALWWASSKLPRM